MLTQAGFANPALDGVSSWFYATAELAALFVDTGFASHAVSDPSSRGARLIRLVHCMGHGD